MIWIAYLIATSYVIALLWLLLGSSRLPSVLRKEEEPSTLFSIVIVFRDEAQHLPLLLQSLISLKYPTEAFEILFVDDASSDHSTNIIHTFFKQHSAYNYQIIENIQYTCAPKKDGITLAISKAKHPWIVTTDADCQVHIHWLRSFNEFIQREDVVCIAGPVLFKSNGTLLQKYQQYDGLSLQLVARGSFGHHQPMVCNGANFAYRKETFKSVQGFEGNTHLSSGDDVFLLEKIQARNPGKVRFLNTPKAIVQTQPVLSWKALIDQRIRWASKSSHQQNRLMKLLGAIVVLNNFIVVLFFFMCLATWLPWLHLGALFLIKLFVDLFVILHTRSLYSVRFSLAHFLGSNLMYPFLNMLIVFKSLNGRVMWKDRPIK